MDKNLEIEYVGREDLEPHPDNPRKHGDSSIRKLEDSIESFGWTNPIIIDPDNRILAGHARLKAAKDMGIEEVPVVRTEPEGEEADAYLIADNRTAEETEWDEDQLGDMFDDLDDRGFDPQLTGFDSEEIEDMTAENQDVREVNEEPIPQDVGEPIVSQGDIWQLGGHRLICGDATDEADREALLDGHRVDLTFTSPPYNADAKTGDGDIFNSEENKQLYTDYFEDDFDSEEYVMFARRILDTCFVATEGYIFWNVCYNANSRYEYIEQITDWLDYLIEQICWKKTSAIPLKGTMRRAWEPVYLFSTDMQSPDYGGVVSNHWEISNTNCQQDEHKACFPVNLPAKAIQVMPDIETVFDPCTGSGTTLIAAEQTDRTFYGMELVPSYCDITIERWENMTGEQAEKIDNVRG